MSETEQVDALRSVTLIFDADTQARLYKWLKLKEITGQGVGLDFDICTAMVTGLGDRAKTTLLLTKSRVEALERKRAEQPEPEPGLRLKGESE